MSVYSETGLRAKFESLENTTLSITGLSQWLLYHWKRHSESVDIWKREYFAALPHRKLLFLYVANDVLQEGRKRGDDFILDFQAILAECIFHLYSVCETEDCDKCSRLLNIWEDRLVFPSQLLDEIRRASEIALRDYPLHQRELAPIEARIDNTRVTTNQFKPVAATKQKQARPNNNTAITMEIDDGETVPVTLESALAELIRTLKELHQSTTKKAELENFVHGLSKSESIGPLESRDLSAITRYASQLDSESSQLQSLQSLLSRRQQLYRRATHLAQLLPAHQKQEEATLDATSNACEKLLRAYASKKQAAQNRIDTLVEEGIVLNKSLARTVSEPSGTTNKRAGSQVTSLSDYKRKKVENPTGNIINDIL